MYNDTPTSNERIYYLKKEIIRNCFFLNKRLQSVFDSILSKRFLMVCVRVCLRLLLCFVLYTNQPLRGRLQPGKIEACRIAIVEKEI